MAWDRWVRRRRSPDALPAYGIPLLQAATIGVLSHPALDWLNTYGIRLLMPFSDTWFHGDSVFIIDPYLWLLLGVGLYAARRVQPDARRVRHRARVMGGTAAAYVAVLIALSAAGERSGATAATQAGIADVREVLYSPQPANPFAADLVVRTGDAYHLGALHWALGHNTVTFNGAVLPRGDWTAAVVTRAQAVPEVQRYLVWSQFPYVRVDVSGADTTIFFGDARYASGLARGLSGLRVTPPPGN
jgi:inner membrane protein